MRKVLLTGTAFLMLFVSGCGKAPADSNKKDNSVVAKNTEADSEKVVDKKKIVINNRRSSSVPKTEYELLEIQDIFKRAEELNGKRVRLIVYGGIRSGDSTERLVPLMTRSDGYVHDETGTLLLRLGWQYSNAYNQLTKQDKDAIYQDEYIKIEKGQWDIKPIVYYKNGNIMLSLKKLR